jgi:hypothetical protein
MLRSIVPRRLDGEDIVTGIERKESILTAFKAEGGVCGVAERRCERERLGRFKYVVDN